MVHSPASCLMRVGQTSRLGLSTIPGIQAVNSLRSPTIWTSYFRFWETSNALRVPSTMSFAGLNCRIRHFVLMLAALWPCALTVFTKPELPIDGSALSDLSMVVDVVQDTQKATSQWWALSLSVLPYYLSFQEADEGDRICMHETRLRRANEEHCIGSEEECSSHRS